MKIFRNEAILIKDDLEKTFKKYKIKIQLDINNEILESIYLIVDDKIKLIDIDKFTKLSELYNHINMLLL